MKNEDRFLIYARLFFDGQQVKCRGVLDDWGDVRTILEFTDDRQCDCFARDFLARSGLEFVRSGAEVTCYGEYDDILELVEDDLRIKPLTYWREPASHPFLGAFSAEELSA